MPHSAACRTRMMQALAGDEEGDKRVKRADARINDFLAKTPDMEDRKRMEKEEGGDGRQKEVEYIKKKGSNAWTLH